VIVPLVRFGSAAGIEAAIGAGSLPKSRKMTSEYALKVRNPSNAFHTSPIGGEATLTEGVIALGATFSAKALLAVRPFDAFMPEDDPYGEHDFGSVTIDERKLFWKIDYYDRSLQRGSNDPSDPVQTTCVLTIMLAEEYRLGKCGWIN
jgi:hypothetical protein